MNSKRIGEKKIPFNSINTFVLWKVRKINCNLDVVFIESLRIKWKSCAQKWKWNCQLNRRSKVKCNLLHIRQLHTKYTQQQSTKCQQKCIWMECHAHFKVLYQKYIYDAEMVNSIHAINRNKLIHFN